MRRLISIIVSWLLGLLVVAGVLFVLFVVFVLPFVALNIYGIVMLEVGLCIILVQAMKVYGQYRDSHPNWRDTWPDDLLGFIFKHTARIWGKVKGWINR